MQVDLEQLPAELRARGLRVTAPRLAVYKAVAEAAGHPDVETIGNGARSLIGSLSTQGVYDALHALTDAGLLRRIEPAGSPARFETRVGDNHHHLVCRSCGRMVDVDCAVGFVPCLTAMDDMGYEIDEAEVVYWGRCPDCVPVAAVCPTRPSRAQRES